MKNKKVFACMLVICILLVGCGTVNKKQKASVYYLNYKPEVADIWWEIAEIYEQETGTKVKVLTVANGNYDQRLKSEIAKREAPTLFHIDGPEGYNTWKNYCLDLSDTDLYSWLLEKDMAITGEDGNGIYGLPYVVEGYGIIYNNAIMQEYFSLSSKAVSYSSMDEVDNFDKLKAVVEDMTAHKRELGIEGVFGSTSFRSGEDWRWQTHLANMPVYFEFEDKNISDTDTLEFTYSDNYKNIFDLYINNSCTQPKDLGKKSVDDSMEEFALGNVAMIQNGNWAWTQIDGVEGNQVSQEDVKFLPIYIGVEGEEGQGLCLGAGSYLSVNSMSSEAEQKATIDFVEWVYNSDIGKDYVTNKLEFIAPFNTFSEDERPSNPLASEVMADMADETSKSVNWVFTVFPSQKFKDDLGEDLFEYSKGELEWNDVIKDAKAEWTSEKASE